MANSFEHESGIASLSVADLIQALKTGPREEASSYCEELIRRFEPLLRSIWRRVSFHLEYEDFVQDVFVSLFAHLPGLKKPGSFPGYFRQVVVSVAIDHLRRARPASEPLDEERLIDLASQVDESILNQVLVTTYLEALSSREREILFMEYVGGYSLREIGSKLKLTHQNVRVIKHRALERLRSIIAAETGAPKPKM